MPRRRVVASRTALSLACLTSALLVLAACRAAPDAASRSASAPGNPGNQEVLAVVDQLQPGGPGEASTARAVRLTVTFPEDLVGVKLAGHYDPRGNLLPGHKLAEGDMLRLTLPPPEQRNDLDLQAANVRLAQ